MQFLCSFDLHFQHDQEGQFYGLLTVILASPDLNSQRSSECQFFVEPISSVSGANQYRCLILEDIQ